MKCLQSKNKVKLDARLIVDGITIRKDSGVGGIKPVKIALARNFKRSIIKVEITMGCVAQGQYY